MRAPASYRVERGDGASWQPVAEERKSPERPAGGRLNTVVFAKTRAARVRVVFIHNGKSRSGVSELEVWRD